MEVRSANVYMTWRCTEVMLYKGRGGQTEKPTCANIPNKMQAKDATQILYLVALDVWA